MFINLLFILLIKSILSFDIDQLNISVWLSSAAYCNKENYTSMVLGGPAMGFIYKNTLYDIKTDLQGYIGVLPSTKTIYVVFRGSSSILNWLDDFEIIKVPYNSFLECKCSVHNGFYRSTLGVKNETIFSITLLKKLYPLYNIIITGHSYGAAISQLIAMELYKNNFNIKVYNFGQPRIGDLRYAQFVNKLLLNNWRMTHTNDIVPHIPPILWLNYSHSCREVFQDSNNNLILCSNTNCEDPLCTNQYSLSQTNGSEHLYYLDHYLSCDSSILNY
jgi:hypothetical protein